MSDEVPTSWWLSRPLHTLLDIGVNDAVLVQLWVYRCIQEFMFLQPRISMHPFYPQAKADLLADKGKRILVMPSIDLPCSLPLQASCPENVQSRDWCCAHCSQRAA